jgi:molybdopterin-guanine dinucleotide biosynthesis protein A
MKPYGLIIAGGKSSRFGSPKHWADVHGIPQWKYHWQELSQICEKVFINISEEEIDADYRYKEIPLIIDRCTEGPFSGLNEAILQHPRKNWIIVGCDYFFADQHCFHEINEHQHSFFFLDRNNIAVPWLGKIVASDTPMLIQQYKKGERSLFQVIEKNNWATLYPSKWEWVQDIDYNKIITVQISENEIDTLDLFTFISGKEWLLRLLKNKSFYFQHEILELLNNEPKSNILNAISAKINTLIWAMNSSNLIEIDSELGQIKISKKK